MTLPAYPLAGGVADWVGLVILPPFAGFLVTGAIAFRRPGARRVVGAVGVGTVAAAFALSVAIFLAVLAAIVGAVVLAKRRL